MKKVLSALLAMLMVVSCMAGITFSVAAEATTMALWSGSYVANQSVEIGASGGNYGQIFTVPADKIMTGFKATFSNSTQNIATFSLYQWNTNRATTVAQNPLFTTAFTAPNDTEMTIDIVNAEFVCATGELYWEVVTTTSNPRIMGATDKAAGVTNVINGEENKKCTGWTNAGKAANTMYATAVLDDKPAVVPTSKKLAGEAGSTQYPEGRNATEIGQRFTVPAGNVLTGYTIGKLYDWKGKNNTGRLDIYQWNTNYAISTAADPLFSLPFADYNGAALEVAIPEDKKIGGEVIAVITYLSGDGAGWKPQGGTEAVAGVYHYVDGLAYAGSTNAKGIYSWIDLKEGEAVNASKYNKVPLYTVGSNIDGQFTNASLSGVAKQTVGQKFTLDGEILAFISFDMLRTYDDAVANNRGVLKVYVWNTDYATTVASTPKYSVEFANHRNNTAKVFAIPTELGLAGTLYWEIECLEASSGMKHGYVPGTGFAKAGVESFRNGTAIASVYAGEKNIGCDVFTLDMEETGTSYPLYVTAGKDQYTGNSNHSAKIGQTAIIPAGKVLSGLDLGNMRKTTYDNGGPVTGTFSVYQWTGNYAETVSRTPLYTQDVSYANNQRALITIPASLMIEGYIFWELAPNSEGIGFNPDAARDQIAGTASYTDGVAKKGPWEKSEYIKSSLLLVDGGIYTAGETTSANLYNGTPDVNVAWNMEWGVRQFGQKFTVPEGNSLKSITMKLNVGGGDGKGTLYFYSWKGDIAGTLKSTPVYSQAVNVLRNDTMYTVIVPSGSGITGDVLWYLDCGSDASPVAFGAAAIGTNVLDIINGELTNQCDGDFALSGWPAKTGDVDGAIALCSTVTYEEIASASVTYINSIDKTVLYSGNVAFEDMPSASKTAFRAAANMYANGTWGAWDGTFTPAPGAPGVYYTNHTYADTVTVKGAITAINNKNFVKVTANPVGFVGWKDNTGAFLSNSAVMKWFPKSADATLTAVYEGEFAPTVSATATIKNGLLTVVVTPTLDSSVSEYGYYISTTGAIDTGALEGVTKVTANNAFAAYLQRVYNLKPATTNVYVLPYIVVNGNVVYGDPVSVAR